ncbi:unnamed protein product [Dracunculus medinensis]|uniref:Uncharacterized protein n=1 Tax=Dracunculus medinensis TaxID=318479 RepID=A0A0N4U2G6_DRAME|nr:unnamed protein product [Dracunculus medinensis]
MRRRNATGLGKLERQELKKVTGNVVAAVLSCRCHCCPLATPQVCHSGASTTQFPWALRGFGSILRGGLQILADCRDCQMRLSIFMTGCSAAKLICMPYMASATDFDLI